MISTFSKDQSIDELAQTANVAQFVSFAPDGRGGLTQRSCRVHGFEPNVGFLDAHQALHILLSRSPERRINLRSYAPQDPRSHEFVYGLDDAGEALANALRLAAEGLFVIANETIDIHDGGVSGVVEGDVIEFAPDDTPRCVEKAGVASFSRDFGLAILSKVYGIRPDFGDTARTRIEFSLHPLARGWKRTHVVAWERETTVETAPRPSLSWPNRFSRHIGDKVFGLLVADELGLPVPRTVCVGRRVAPFVFGRPTGSPEVWTRTCPREPEPGLFTTRKGWIDPFKLLAIEDPDGTAIVSVLRQDAVPARHSGAAIVTADGRLAVEGKAGEGDGLMLGVDHHEPLPTAVCRDVSEAYARLEQSLGPSRFEWVHDGSRVWVVQLHLGATSSSATTLVPGTCSHWVAFEASQGLDALRGVLRDLPVDGGLRIVGRIGLTSHLADLIRKAGRPATMDDASTLSYPVG